MSEDYLVTPLFVENIAQMKLKKRFSEIFIIFQRKDQQQKYFKESFQHLK
jgi:hypothetical protein